MDTQKIVVILLIVAILMSVISIIVSVSTMSGLGPINIPTRETIRNFFYKTENNGPDGGNLELTILPPPSNSGGGA